MAKKSFLKKGLSILLAMLMMLSLFSVAVFAETITLTFENGMANLSTYNTAEMITGFEQKDNTSVKGGTASGLSLTASSEGTTGSATWSVDIPQGEAGKYQIQLRYKNELTDTSTGASVKESIIEESVTVNEQTDTDLEVMSGMNSDSDIVGIFDFSEGINTLTVQLKVKDWNTKDSITPAVLFTNIVLTKKEMPQLGKTETTKIGSHDCTSYRGREEDAWASNSSWANCYDMDGSGDGAHIILGYKGNYASYTFNVTESYSYDLKLNLRFWDACAINIYVDDIKENTFKEDAGKRKTLDAGTYFLEKGVHTIRIEQATNNKALFYYYLELSVAENANLLDSNNRVDLNLVSDMISVKTTDKATTNRFSHGEIVDTSLPYITVNSQGNEVNPQYVLFGVDAPIAGYYDVSLIGGSSNEYMDFKATVIHDDISKDFLLRYVSATEAERTVGGSVINPFFFSHRDTLGKIYLDEGKSFVKLTATYGDAYLLNIGLEKSRQELNVALETKLSADAVCYLTDESYNPVLVTGDTLEISANKIVYYEIYSPVAITYTLKTYTVGEEVGATITNVDTNETICNGAITRESDSEIADFEVGSITLNQGYTTLKIDVLENAATLHYLGFVPQIDPDSIVKHTVPAYEETVISAEDYTLYTGSKENTGFIEVNDDDKAIYNIEVERAGNYSISLNSAQDSAVTAVLIAGSEELTWELEATNSIAEYSENQTLLLSEGKHSFVLSANDDMNLYSIKLKRIGTNDSTDIGIESSSVSVVDYCITTGNVNGDETTITLDSGESAEYKLNALNDGIYKIKLGYKKTDEDTATIEAKLDDMMVGSVLLTESTEEAFATIENVEIENGAKSLKLSVVGEQVIISSIYIEYKGVLPIVLTDEPLTIEAENFTNFGECTSITDGARVVVSLGGKNAEYTVKSPVAKTYKVTASLKATDTGSIFLLIDGQKVTTKNITSTFENYEDVLIGYVNISNVGSHILALHGEGNGDIFLDSVSITVAQESDVQNPTIKVLKQRTDGADTSKDANYGKFIVGSGGNSTNPDVPLEGSLSFNSNGNYVLYNTEIPSSGIYEIAVYVGAKSSSPMSITIADGDENIVSGSASGTEKGYLYAVRYVATL